MYNAIVILYTSSPTETNTAQSQPTTVWWLPCPCMLALRCVEVGTKVGPMMEDS